MTHTHVTTETSVTQRTQCPEWQPHTADGNKPTNNTQEDSPTNTRHLDPYDQVRPTNEPKFMTAVRNWEKRVGFVTPIRWKDAILITLFHVVSVVWFTYTVCFLYSPKWQTILFAILVGQLAGFGVTAGAHRYWCHRSYKATRPLQVILLICYSIAGQNSIYNWVRDHRVHHKFSETSADPHDARRGFFFAHVGWLMMKKHPAVLREGAKIDMSDISGDPLVRFHTRYFTLWKVAWCFVLPTLLPAAWGERWALALQSQALVRYMCSLHFTWAVNSFAHLWGNKPYDRNIMPAENWGVSVVAMGEGWHNYHHTFPWDYRAAELGHSLNVTTLLLDALARAGCVWARRAAAPALVAAVAARRGDGSRTHTSIN